MGAPQSEQGDPESNPDFKDVFDCGFELPPNDPYAEGDLSVYAPSLWPDIPAGFMSDIQQYFSEASEVAMKVLRAIAVSVHRDENAVDHVFRSPMALFRGNFFHERPDWAGDRDFGIAAHAGYSRLTLLSY